MEQEWSTHELKLVKHRGEKHDCYVLAPLDSSFSQLDADQTLLQTMMCR